jgi:hypothetical protein
MKIDGCLNPLRMNGDQSTMGSLAIVRGLLVGAVMMTASLAVALPACWAVSPEENYFAARDAAIKKILAFEDAKEGEKATKEHERAFADLERQPRTIVGPVSIKGLLASGTLNLGSLYTGDEGYGTLGGRVYVAYSAVTRKFATIPACDKIRAEHEAKSDDICEAYQATDPKDETLFEQFTSARDLADTLFLLL